MDLSPIQMAALAEYQKRNKPVVSVLDESFPMQAEFIRSPSKRKSLFCTRRAAKSFTGGLYMVHTALTFPGTNSLYLGLTRQSAKDIIWKDILKTINNKHALNMKFNETELSVTFSNGSTIRVTGVDDHETEMEKLLGKKYKLVIVDEAASYSIDLRRLVYGIIGPALVDQQGTVCLMGTSGDLTQGLFYDITTKTEGGWELFQWTAYDNPYVAKQWEDEINDIRMNRPKFMDTPIFKQWYLNEWVVDNDKLVYRFDDSKNSFQRLPDPLNRTWQYVLGVDLGYSPDPSAFVLCTFNENDPCLYILESFKKTEMDVTDVANKIKEYQARFNIFKVVIDNANKQAIEEIQRRHGIALTSAEKTGKADFIQVMNAEFIQGKIKILCSEQNLREEYPRLIWAMDGDKIKFPRKENENCANHAADAALYAWRFCYQYLSEPAIKPVDMRDKGAYLSHTQKLMDERLEKQIQYEQSMEREGDILNLQQMDIDENPLQYYINKRKG